MTHAGVTPCAEARVDGVPPRFELASWQREWGLVAGITGRVGDTNLGPWTDEPARGVMERWFAFLAEMRPRFRGAVVARQVHGTDVAVHVAAARGLSILADHDGHLTDLPGLLLTVTVADCVPVYLAHPESGTVALLHAGWRGLAAGIVEQGIARVSARARCLNHDIVMHCGVGICGACYEVGSEVVQALTGRHDAGRDHVDLRQIAASRAHDRGVERITNSSWCTAHDAEHFYSHRGLAGRAGRMVAYLGRPMA